VDFGPCVVLEQWLCGSEWRSVRGTRAKAVWYWIVVRAWYLSSGCVEVDLGPRVGLLPGCVLLEHIPCVVVERGPCSWYLSSGCVVVEHVPWTVIQQFLYICATRSVR
jgi:hypothetical protein